MKRESFRSRLGFLLVSAGCAIGIGNVWRFPYVTGKNGGGYFVLFGRRPREPQERDPRLQDARKAQVQVAHPRLVLPDRLLPLDDVLHDGFRLDGELLWQISDR